MSYSRYLPSYLGKKCREHIVYQYEKYCLNINNSDIKYLDAYEIIIQKYLEKCKSVSYMYKIVVPSWIYESINYKLFINSQEEVREMLYMCKFFNNKFHENYFLINKIIYRGYFVNSDKFCKLILEYCNTSDFNKDNDFVSLNSKIIIHIHTNHHVSTKSANKICK